MHDPIETLRADLAAKINSASDTREELELKYGKVWDSDELQCDFEVMGFAAPLVVVRRWSDGVVGSLYFQHLPRYYFLWRADRA